jgi:hypothetical protein
MTEKDKQLQIQINVDFTIAAIKFSGSVTKTDQGILMAGKASNINLNQLFEPGFDLEIDEVSCGYFTGNSDFFFRVVLGNCFNLSNLPLLCKILPKEQSITIDNLSILIKGHRDISLDPKNTGVGNGTKTDVCISADLHVGNKTIKIPGDLQKTTESNISIVKPQDKNDQTNEIIAPDHDKEDNTLTGLQRLEKTSWVPINKSVGPVLLKRIGFKLDFKESRLSVDLDASMTLGPLGISFYGLSVSSSIKQFKPEFHLSGLGISYSQGNILISGALLYDRDDSSFTGCVIIKTPIITIAALGGYKDMNGDPSLFIYGVISSDTGIIAVSIGPVFLSITGICAGFGYNRQLIIPPVEKVKEFPLVSVASGDTDLGKNPLEIIQKVKEYIPAVKGQLFFAFGVKLNIQKLIDCLALLIFNIGHKISIDIIGLAKIALPTPSAGSDQNTLALIEMAYKVSFNFEEGAVQISAILTPASFIFSKSCRLTGGFAFYAWFYGSHEGEFVLTIGGYHPQFKVPSHYPTVPRVGFAWQLLPSLSIKGEMYCALTPSSIMAGGLFEAVFKTEKTVGFNIGIAGATLTGIINACFLMRVDFFIAWKPFSYDISAFIDIAIQVAFRGTARFLWFSKTIEKRFDLHLSAGLHIWGPEFSGNAHVNWSIISFDIDFGKKNNKIDKVLPWPDFKNAFLPENDNENSDANSSIFTISIVEGLQKQYTQENNDTILIVNPAELKLSINTVIPLRSYSFNWKKDNVQCEFGIPSMNLPNLNTSELTITHYHKNSNEIQFDIQFGQRFDIQPITKNVPSAIWGTQPIKDNYNSPTVINDLLTGFTISPIKNPSGQIDHEEKFNNIQEFPWHWESDTTIDYTVPNHDTKITVEQKIKRDKILKCFNLTNTPVTFDTFEPLLKCKSEEQS